MFNKRKINRNLGRGDFAKRRPLRRPMGRNFAGRFDTMELDSLRDAGKNNAELLADKCRIINEHLFDAYDNTQSYYRRGNPHASIKSPRELIKYFEQYKFSKDETVRAICAHLISVLRYLMGETTERPESLAVSEPVFELSHRFNPDDSNRRSWGRGIRDTKAGLQRNLTAAAYKGNNDAILDLLQRGAKINEQDSSGVTALTRAAMAGNLDTVELLIQHGAKVNKPRAGGYTAVLDATFAHHTDVVEYLIFGADANISIADELGRTVRSVAEERGYTDILDLLDGMEVLTVHPDNFSLSREEYLTDELSKAIENHDDSAVIRLIEDEGADVNEPNGQGCTPVMVAVLAWSASMVELLANLGADVNDSGYYHETALGYAARYGLEDVVDALLSAGADVDMKDRDKSTPLMSIAGAFSNGKLDETKYGILEDLLDAGADVNAEDSDGKTPLLHALTNLKTPIEVVEALIKAGADIDYGKPSPLTYAIAAGRLDVIQRLVEAGAKVGENAIELAEKDGHTKILSYLKQVGNKKDSKHFSALRDESPEGKSNEEILAEKVKIINDRLHEHNYLSEKDNYDAEQIIDFLEEQLGLGYLPENTEIAADHLISVLEYLTGKSDRRPRSLAAYQPAELICSNIEDYQREGDFDQLYDSHCWEGAIKRGDIDQLQIQYDILDNVYVPEKDYTNHPIDNKNHTGLWVAITQPDPDIEVVKFLLDKGADLKQWSDQGYPSHWKGFKFDMLEEAIENIENEDKAIEVAKLLIDAGAEVNEYYNLPVLDIAKEKGFKKLVKFLKEQGATGFAEDKEE